MSDLEKGSAQPSNGRQAIDRRAWSREHQWRTAGVGAVAVVLLILGIWLGGRFFGKHEAPAPPASPPGTFRATPQQMKTFTIETVGLHGFVSEQLTEGKIAVNADRATPLFSPFSGRVIRVIAGPGA